MGHPASELILQSRAVCVVLGTAASLSPSQKPLRSRKGPRPVFSGGFVLGARFPHLVQLGTAAQQPCPGQQSTQACCRDLVLYFHPPLQLKSIGSPQIPKGRVFHLLQNHGVTDVCQPLCRDIGSGTQPGWARLQTPSSSPLERQSGAMWGQRMLMAGGLMGSARAVGWDVPFPLQAAAWRCRHHHRLPQGMPPAEPGRA